MSTGLFVVLISGVVVIISDVVIVDVPTLVGVVIPVVVGNGGGSTIRRLSLQIFQKQS